MRKLVLFIFLTGIFAGCKRSEEENAHLKHLEEGAPTKEAFQVRFLFSENAIIQAALEAPHALEAKDGEEEYRLFDKGLHLVFFNPDGEIKSELNAQQGKFRNQFNDAEVWGNVVMLNEKGDKLETERLFWNKNDNRIHTNEFVKIRTATEIIYGDSMDANTDFSEYKIYNIRGSISVKEAEL